MARWKRVRRFMTGFEPVVTAREGFVYGIRQPNYGPIFDAIEDAEYWCIAVMEDHYGRMTTMADAEIHFFKGMTIDVLRMCGKKCWPN